MSILSFNIQSTGLVGETVNPRRGTIVSTADLSTITANGYLNGQNLLGYPILPTDIFDVIYNFDEVTQAGDFGIFKVSYNIDTGYSLVYQYPGNSNVLLPVVDGNIAIFNGTSGQIKDSGESPANIIFNNETNTMTSGNCLYLDKGTLTLAAGAQGTLNTQAGIITVTGLNIMAGENVSIGMSNNKLLSNSVFLVNYIDSGGLESLMEFIPVIDRDGHVFIGIYNPNDFTITGSLAIHFAIF